MPKCISCLKRFANRALNNNSECCYCAKINAQNVVISKVVTELNNLNKRLNSISLNALDRSIQLLSQRDECTTQSNKTDLITVLVYILMSETVSVTSIQRELHLKHDCAKLIIEQLVESKILEEIKSANKYRSLLTASKLEEITKELRNCAEY